MSADLKEKIAGLLDSEAGGRKLKVAVLFQANASVAQKIAVSGHSSILFGDRFLPLWRIYRRALKSPAVKSTFIEARLDALPIRSHSLDALVLLCRVPAEPLAKNELRFFRSLLNDAGLLVWPHPVTDGFLSSAARMVFPFGPRIYERTERHRLCSLAMESGFKEVGQILVPGRIAPWVVTTARKAPRPFENKSV